VIYLEEFEEETETISEETYVDKSELQKDFFKKFGWDGVIKEKGNC